jgi:hypothetical protein
MKITVGIGFTPFYENDASMLIKINDKLFTLVGKQTSELQPYPAMNVKEKNLIDTFKDILYLLENGLIENENK